MYYVQVVHIISSHLSRALPASLNLSNSNEELRWFTTPCKHKHQLTMQTQPLPWFQWINQPAKKVFSFHSLEFLTLLFLGSDCHVFCSSMTWMDRPFLVQPPDPNNYSCSFTKINSEFSISTIHNSVTPINSESSISTIHNYVALINSKSSISTIHNSVAPINSESSISTIHNPVTPINSKSSISTIHNSEALIKKPGDIKITWGCEIN